MWKVVHPSLNLRQLGCYHSSANIVSNANRVYESVLTASMYKSKLQANAFLPLLSALEALEIQSSAASRADDISQISRFTPIRGNPLAAPESQPSPQTHTMAGRPIGISWLTCTDGRLDFSPNLSSLVKESQKIADILE